MDEDSASSSSKKDSKRKASRKRGTKLSAIEMLEKKYERKSDLKERELQLKAEELELQRTRGGSLMLKLMKERRNSKWKWKREECF